ncbi:MAG: hypothetical protein GVY22_12780 [Gammaproteobacteria bacterium]|jgi:hypothetical protein|nr:hypothetical protein [Gammaproteobacteria bacterium]
MISDRRAKTKHRGDRQTSSGLPLYEFRYRGSNAVYRGVMAQNALDHTPAAMIERPSGYLAVDDGMLGLASERLRW